MSAPRWASDLLAEVWAAEGTGPLPTLGWHRTQNYSSSGRAWSESPPRLHVSAGYGRRGLIYTSENRRRLTADQRIVLLHEIAHGICYAGSVPESAHHGRGFWMVAWGLFMRYRGSVPMQQILAREADYRSHALPVAASLNVSGARALAHARSLAKEGAMPTTTAKAAPKKRATKKAAAATTEGTPLTEKRCPGVASVGREPHVAPVDEFHKNVQHKDGLSRLCKTCNTLYTAHLRAQKAAKEATAAEAPAAEPTPVAAEQPADDPAATSAVASLMEMPATPAPKPSDGEPAARRQRAARERQLARAGGAESEAGQALLAQWAAESRKATRDARKGQKA